MVGPGVQLTDTQWARIEPLLPDRTPKRGGRWREHREVIDTIAFKFQSGTQWVHLPGKYGNWRGVYNRLRMWAVDGTWERVFTTREACQVRPASHQHRPGQLRRSRACHRLQRVSVGGVTRSRRYLLTASSTHLLSPRR
ncbi:transposase [Streptomyces variegatus]|uniref:transposase n=1 Tax=Streptomyces variegatus TaxID=284040 RepID=UPI003C2CBAA1